MCVCMCWCVCVPGFHTKSSVSNWSPSSQSQPCVRCLMWYNKTHLLTSYLGAKCSTFESAYCVIRFTSASCKTVHIKKTQALEQRLCNHEPVVCSVCSAHSSHQLTQVFSTTNFDLWLQRNKQQNHCLSPGEQRWPVVQCPLPLRTVWWAPSVKRNISVH